MISERFCQAAFSPFISVSAVMTSARRVATSGSSQPRTGDQRSVEGSPDMPCGSNTVTGLLPVARAFIVTTRLSARVDVVTTAPGASRIALITT
jgi:hypothetical protein